MKHPFRLFPTVCSFCIRVKRGGVVGVRGWTNVGLLPSPEVSTKSPVSGGFNERPSDAPLSGLLSDIKCSKKRRSVENDYLPAVLTTPTVRPSILINKQGSRVTF